MNNDDNGADKRDSSIIKPAEISLTRETTEAGEKQAPAVRRSPFNRPVAIALSLLLAAVITVIFFLPDWIDEPVTQEAGDATATEPSGQTGSSTPPSPKGAARDKTPAATPWSDAQLARLRQQSQDLLADMLEAQETLKNHYVREWAADDYHRAQQTAEQGDTAYQERRFQEAVDLYRRALEQFTTLVDSMGRVYQQAVEQGQQALEQGDAERAATQFKKALLIRPDDKAALRGQERAATLDEVNALMAEGDAALDEGRLEQAKEKYGKALQIDPYAKKAKTQLAEVNNRLRERNFRQAMSSGYAALEQGRLQQAREAFTRAEKLKPASAEVGQALALVREKVNSVRINEHLATAREAVAAEDWQTAVNHFQQALSLDNSLATAQAGLEKTRRRLDLDRRLVQAINNPERLWDEAVREETRRLLQEARSVQPTGTRLAEQIAALARLLEKATTPVTVRLRSDSQTSVTVYKVGDMGKFEEKTVTLLPGRYVAVGKRPGYRDVRVEFTVRPDKGRDPVVIETTEKINLGSG